MIRSLQCTLTIWIGILSYTWRKDDLFQRRSCDKR